MAMRRWGLAVTFCSMLAGAAGQCLAGETLLSPSSIDGVRSHVMKFWSPPAKGPDSPDVAVEIRVTLAADGAVTSVEDFKRPETSSPYRDALAQSAMRAVRLASPLPLPAEADKRDLFRKMVLAFNPKPISGGR